MGLLNAERNFMLSADSEHIAITLAVLFLVRVVCVSWRNLYTVKALPQAGANLLTNIGTTRTLNDNVGSTSPDEALGRTEPRSLEIISGSIRSDQFLKLRIVYLLSRSFGSNVD